MSEHYVTPEAVDKALAAEVVTTAMREWDRQHEWQHLPGESAADKRETEQELARVVAALRV